MAEGVNSVSPNSLFFLVFLLFHMFSFFSFFVLWKKMNHNHNNNNNNEGDGGDDDGDGDGGGDGGDIAEGSGGKEKKGPMMTVVLKIRMYCDGCEHAIAKYVSTSDGVDFFKVDRSSNEVTIVGSYLDASKIRDRLQKKTRKQVDLILPQIKNDRDNDPKPDNDNSGGGGDGGNVAEGNGGKKEEKGPMMTMVLKIHMYCYCDGCADNIAKHISTSDGVKSFKVDRSSNVVTIVGSCLYPSKIRDRLQKRTGKRVDLIFPQIKNDNYNDPKPNNDNSGGGGGGGGNKKKLYG